MHDIDGSPQPVSGWARGSRPIWLVALIGHVVSLVAPALTWINPDSRFLPLRFLSLIVFVSIGVFLGQFFFVALASALRWRSWPRGYAMGIALLSSTLLAVALGMWLADSHEDAIYFVLALIPLIPALLLSLALPLIAFRFLLGWRLVAADEITPPRETFRLGDLFALMTVLAANLVLVRLPNVLQESSGNATDLFFLCGAFFAIGLLILPPCVRLGMGTRRRLVAVAGLTLLAVLIPACICTIIYIAMLRDTSGVYQRETMQVLAQCGGALVTLYGALFFLARCGLSLVRTDRAQAAELGTVESRRSDTGWLAVSSIAVAFLTAIYIAHVHYLRDEAKKELARLETVAEQLDGSLWIENGRVRTIQLGERATDSDLEPFLQFVDVVSIHLSSSSITDAGVAKLKHFPKTKSLSLNGTKVTDQGLAILSKLSQLDRIELNNTQVTGSGLASLTSRPSLKYILLDDTPVDDVGLRALRRFPNLRELSLAGTRVTNAGLGCLSEFKNLESLNLSRTAVTPDALPELKSLSSLYLGGTKTDDAMISRIANWQNLVTLDLSRTAITDVGLEQLGTLRRLSRLSLADTAVTGDGFHTWSDHGPLKTLTLARTALHDGAVENLVTFSPIQELDLSQTQVSDACLARLDRMRVNFLFVCQSRITGEGLLSAGMAKIGEVIVMPGQLTESEFQQVRQRRPEWVKWIAPEVWSQRQLNGGLVW